MNAQIKKVTVWLLATGLVLAAAAMLIPKQAVAAVAAQVFLVNHSVPTSNPLPTRDVGAQTVLVFDQTVAVDSNSNGAFPPIDVSIFKEIRVWATVDGSKDYALLTQLPDPNNGAVTVTLDDINASKTGAATKTYDIVWPKLVLFVAGGNSGTSTIHILVYGRTN